MLSQVEMINKYASNIMTEGKLYKKYKQVMARLGVVGEEIITITDSGVETKNTVKEAGDMVVQNSTLASEQYIISAKKFADRYEGPEAVAEWQVYMPKGKVNAIIYDGEDMEFMASWGEAMTLKKGDMLCSTDGSEVYRIGLSEFQATYMESESEAARQIQSFRLTH